MVEATLDAEKAKAETAARTDVTEQLLKPEAQEALAALIEQLPKIAEMMTTLTQVHDFAKKVATDRVLIEDTIAGLQEILKPLEEKAKFIAATTIEANERAEKDSTTIGVFGLMKMLKDPEIQKLLRFGQAYLDVLGEKKKQG
ncbi:DUF1641 domain-containing protein [Xylanibacillus composti]|uniref:DUF1641 domain-containing protein n=1 Tax=Xylanibacillus composti TaxID=1572762 RepID=A0A8J4M359_9BACL|nr:DUF1641 domain-containing protein [Xylanibacillus composti]MDT9726319.1 DUF1641 domain-containing protein [Xylanibacillus composti]GIQ70575.1 hypothetical protein XYCOK13_33990 [Xylanibacillus composti]